MIHLERLPEDYRQRKKDVWENIYKTFYGLLFFISNKITHDKEASEEIANDSLLVLDTRDDLDFKTFREMRAYLATIAKNKSITWFNKKRRDDENYKLFQYHLEQDEEISNIAELEMQNALTVDDIRQEILQLPPKQSKIAYKILLEDKSPKQVAEELGIHEQTVYKQLNAAELKLQRKFGPHYLFIIHKK